MKELDEARLLASVFADGAPSSGVSNNSPPTSLHLIFASVLLSSCPTAGHLHEPPPNRFKGPLQKRLGPVFGHCSTLFSLDDLWGLGTSAVSCPKARPNLLCGRNCSSAYTSGCNRPAVVIGVRRRGRRSGTAQRSSYWLPSWRHLGA